MNPVENVKMSIKEKNPSKKCSLLKSPINKSDSSFKKKSRIKWNYKVIKPQFIKFNLFPPKQGTNEQTETIDIPVPEWIQMPDFYKTAST